MPARLQQEMKAFGAQVGQPVTLQQAQALGLDRQVRQRLVTARRAGQRGATHRPVGRRCPVAQEIMQMPAFKGATGSFDRETYRFTLERNNLTETEFETSVRETWPARCCRAPSPAASPPRRR